MFMSLLIMHQAAGQLQCPQVSASFRDGLDFSLSVSLYQPEGVGDDGSVSEDDQCKLITRLTVQLYVYGYIATCCCRVIFSYACV